MFFAEKQNALTIFGGGDYDLLCKNCVDFAGQLFERIGQSSFAIADHLIDGTLADIYANTVKYLCVNPWEGLMESEAWSFPMPSYVGDYAYSKGMAGFYGFGFTNEVFAFEQELARAFGPSLWSKFYNFEAMALDHALNGSPIALDLNQDGIRTISLEDSKVYFDIDNDGVEEHTGWLSADDAFLVWDRNSDGKITSATEMFGGLKRGEGYAKLQELDTDRNQLVDQDDEGFGMLQLWRDLNGNGLSEAGELSSLEANSIKAIGTDYGIADWRDQRNLIGEISFAKLGNKAILAADVYFRYREKTSTVDPNALIAAMAASQFAPTPPADTGPAMDTMRSLVPS